MRRQRGSVLAAHRFLKGEREDAPLLVPLAVQGRPAREIVQFCRLIYPGASILAPTLDAYGWDEGTPAEADSLLARRLARLIGRVGFLYDLTLVPVVVIGCGPGADLAAQVALQCTTHVAACILLRPARSTAAVPFGSLSGLSVLLACDGEAGGVGGVEHALCRLLTVAGADVIAARVGRRRTPGGSDVAICQVFLETLFPASRAGPAFDLYETGRG